MSEPLSPSADAQRQFPRQVSLYESSPTPSDEGGSPSKKPVLATRFYTPATAAPAVPVSHQSSSMSHPAHRAGSNSAPMLQHLAQRNSSIYSSGSNSASNVQQASTRRASSAPPVGKAVGNTAGSHTSLVDLQHFNGAEVAVEVYLPASGAAVKDTFWPCTFNLSKVIMGAGMMAIPKAFMLLGLIPGGVLMLLIACFTFFTLAALISTSDSTGTRSSYGALVRKTLGGKAEAALQVAVLANCYVMNVVFVVVLGDILIGSAPEYGGLLPEWTGCSPEDCVWLRRDAVLGAVSLAVLLPLAAMRSMERLAIVNIIGVACNGVFAGLMLALAAGAAANGVLQPPPLMPNWSELGSTPLLAAVAIATVVPVLLNCDVCHQSLHPLMPLLQPYSVARMQRLVALALAICNTLYMAVTICSGLVFGSALQPDVLSNVNSAAMAPLIGPHAAVVMAAFVRVGYLLSIMGSYVLLCYPLRQCLGDLFLPGGQASVQKHWQLLTFGLVASCAAIGCYLPSIWGALALVGATASTVQAFIIPGFVVITFERAAVKTARRRGAAAALAAQQQQEGLLTPLLSPAASATAGTGDVAQYLALQGNSRGGGSSSMLVPSLAAAAADAGSKVWLSVLRQIVAAIIILIGVGLFGNSVVDSLWEYAHPRDQNSIELMGLYRQLFAL